MPYKDVAKQRAHQLAWSAASRAKEKQIVLAMFNRKCRICGFDNPKALELDHIIEIRRNTATKNDSSAGTGLWHRMARGLLNPEDFQLLCANCHSIKTYDALYVKSDSTNGD